jgi:hypothetical protein
MVMLRQLVEVGRTGEETAQSELEGVGLLSLKIFSLLGQPRKTLPLH